MKLGTKLLLNANKLFPIPQHPFNSNINGEFSYEEWQYEHGADTLNYYAPNYTSEEMFREKTVLDIGCGAGGKSVYYASLGASHVTGIDLLEKYERRAELFSLKKGMAEKFSFCCTDAASTPFPDASFDTVIMNDAMEHVQAPLSVLQEIERVLVPGGKLFINFSPVGHPYGAHLMDLIGIPWVHKIFSEKTCIEAYKCLANSVVDGQERISFRISENDRGEEYFSYINWITLSRFSEIRKRSNLDVEYYKEMPFTEFGGCLRPLVKIPKLKEYFTKMCVCVLVK